MRESLDRRPPYRLEFELLGVPEALNKMLRMHWMKRNKHSHYWYEYIANETRKLKPKEPLRYAKITLVRYSPRTLDFDGAIGSFKVIVDGLKRAGIILDDRWDYVGAWCLDQVKAKEQKIKVIVEEVIQPQGP